MKLLNIDKRILNLESENGINLKDHFTSHNSFKKIFRNFNYNGIKKTTINYNYFIKLFLSFIKGLFIHLLFFFIYLYYFLSLEICTDGIEICSQKFEWIIKKVKQEIISCILMTIMIQLMIFCIVPKKHLVHIIIVFIFFFNYSHGLNFDDHGYYNVICSISLIMILILLISPLNCIVYLVKLNNKIIYIFLY